MFEFAWWWAFFALPFPLIARLLPAKPKQEFSALRVPHLLPENQGQVQADRKPVSRLLWLSLIWIALVTATARPQWLGEPVNIPLAGRDLMLAVDLSGSMKIDDMQVNGQQVDRLVMLKSVLRDFITRRVGDRLGLILFADTAYLQTPLTYDRETVRQLLDETVIGLVGEQTAIGDAIGLATKRFDQKKDSNRVLVLLTDGQNTAGNISPQQAQELAVEKDVTIYTIGVGADAMVVRSFFGTRNVNPSQELDEDMLSEIAEATGGQYFRARDAESLADIYATLDKLEPIERESRQMRPQSALFYYPLGFAFLCSVLMALPQLVSSLRFKLRGAAT